MGFSVLFELCGNDVDVCLVSRHAKNDRTCTWKPYFTGHKGCRDGRGCGRYWMAPLMGRATRTRARLRIEAASTEVLAPTTLRFGTKLVLRVYVAVNAAVAVLVDVALVAGPNINTVVRVLSFVAWTIIGGLLVVWLDRCVVRVSVTAKPSGLYIYNGLRTHVVTWAEVEGFEASSRPYLMAVKRTHGRPIPMAGITPGLFGNPFPRRLVE
jgi:Bacterial PH domain